MGKVSSVAAVDKTSVALAIILSIIILHETVSLKVLIGALLVITGTMVIILNKEDQLCHRNVAGIACISG